MFRSGDRIGSYILSERIGRGAFGTVWLAEETTALSSHKVALKLPNDDQIDIEEIRQEAVLWEKVKGHPNILPIIKADIFEDQVYIASEYAPDGSLSDWLKRNNGAAPSGQVAVEMINGILAGLAHLHSRNVIHRDLKPDNILLQGDIPRIADFGIARALKESHSSQIAGTPNYMAPEGFRGVRSVQTDIWATGVIFYQLLTGLLPYPQKDLPSLVNAIVHEGPQIDSERLSAPILRIVRLAIEKDVSNRYKTVADMRQDLRRISVNELDDISALPTMIATQTVTDGFGSQSETIGAGQGEDAVNTNPDVPDTFVVLDETVRNDVAWTGRIPGYSGKYIKWGGGAAVGLAIIGAMIYGTMTFGVGNSNDPTATKIASLTGSNAAGNPAERRAMWAEWAAMMERAEYDKIVSETTDVISRDPINVIAYRMRAMAYCDSGRGDLGRNDIREVLRLADNPVTAEEFEAACYALGNLNKVEEALPNCSKAIEKDPALSFSYNIRGTIYYQKQMYEMALADFSKAIELTPRASYYRNRSYTYREMGKTDLAADDERTAILFDNKNAQNVNKAVFGENSNRGRTVQTGRTVSRATAVGKTTSAPTPLATPAPTPLPVPKRTPIRVTPKSNPSNAANR